MKPIKVYNGPKSASQEELQPNSKPNRVIRLLKNKHFQSVMLLVLIDLAIPLAIYYSFRTFTTEVIALIVSGIPPCIRAIIIFIKERRVEIISCIVVLSFVIPGALAAVSGDVRIALLQDSIVTAVIGLMFFLTMIPLRTKWVSIYPMTHLAGQQMVVALEPLKWKDQNDEQQEMKIPDFVWKYMRAYRVGSYALTLMWGIGLVAIFGVRCAMIYKDVPPEKVVGIGTAVSAAVNATMAAVSAVSFYMFRKKYIKFVKEWKETNDYSPQEYENKDDADNDSRRTAT